MHPLHVSSVLRTDNLADFPLSRASISLTGIFGGLTDSSLHHDELTSLADLFLADIPPPRSVPPSWPCCFLAKSECIPCKYLHWFAEILLIPYQIVMYPLQIPSLLCQAQPTLRRYFARITSKTQVTPARPQHTLDSHPCGLTLVMLLLISPNLPFPCSSLSGNETRKTFPLQLASVVRLHHGTQSNAGTDLIQVCSFSSYRFFRCLASTWYRTLDTIDRLLQMVWSAR